MCHDMPAAVCVTLKPWPRRELLLLLARLALLFSSTARQLHQIWTVR